MRALSAVLLVLASAASGQELGTGRDGARVVAGREALNRYSPLQSDLPAGSQQLSVAIENLLPGELVMILQTQLGTIPFAGGTTAYYPGSSVNVGRYELARLGQRLDAGLYALEQPTLRGYSAQGAQAVSVPEFTTLTITDAGVLTGLPWDGRSGGVVAALVQQDLALTGAVSASGLGFRGNPRRATSGEGISANGYGQDGQASISGGPATSGGSNAGSGGRGTVAQLGGTPLKATPGERLLFGGGGGTWDAWGNAGGGVVFVRAATISGSGRVAANGLGGDGAVSNYLGGGGGAGGTIDLRALGGLSCEWIQANGGRGGSNVESTDNRTGGGGSGGRIYIEAAALTGCAPQALAGLRGAAGPGIANWSQPTDPADPTYAGEIVLAVDAGTGRTDGATVSIVHPAEGMLFNTPRPVVAGRASAEVQVLVDGAEAGTAAPLPDGGFVFLLGTDLPDGAHRVQARTATGTASREVAFSIDTVPPSRPELLLPRHGDVLATSTPSIEGSAPAGSRLELSLDGRVLHTEVVPASGTFLVGVPAARALERGAHTLDATVFDEAGNFAADHVEFTVGRTPTDPDLKVQSGCAAAPAELLTSAWLVVAYVWARRRRARRYAHA